MLWGRMWMRLLMPLLIFSTVSLSEEEVPMSIYEIQVQTIEEENTTLTPYRGKVMLVVNTASECGFTPQLEGLEKLYREYETHGFTVLGFPCNQFMGQEPLEGEAIRNFCQTNYSVTFPIFAKIEVNGENTHPLYAYLKKEAPGFLGSELIKWNFTKFLVDRNGHVVERYAPSTKPDELREAIEKLL